MLDRTFNSRTETEDIALSLFFAVMQRPSRVEAPDDEIDELIDSMTSYELEAVGRAAYSLAHRLESAHTDRAAATL